MYRARSTSAAPTYFEPYFHDGKGQSYIDGALLRNNPVQLIEDERHMIWKDRSPPDIILSVGTGIQADTGGETKSVSKRAKIAKRLIPKGLRGKIAVGLDMIQSTLDCDRQWSEFLSSTKRDPNISSICHRIWTTSKLYRPLSGKQRPIYARKKSNISTNGTDQPMSTLL
jgi:hypothetical protein